MSATNNELELVIFDCDGVLVDSEPIANRVLLTMVQELGLTLTMTDLIEHFVGRSMQQCVATLAQLLGDAPPANFAEQYRARTSAAFASELLPVAGVKAVLDQLTIGYCVASSSDHARLRTTLGLVGLLARFEGKLFSVTEVANGKPAPDVFLHAARRLGAEPARCLVIEDTPTGVAAGIAAGMTVFGYAGFMPAARLSAAGAQRTFAHMSELPRLIALGLEVSR